MAQAALVFRLVGSPAASLRICSDIRGVGMPCSVR